MYKLKVKIPKLNIRNTPEADPKFENWAGDCLFGEIIHAIDKVQGTVFENKSNWYKDSNNRYYWEGGLDVITEHEEPTDVPTEVPGQPLPSTPGINFPPVKINWKDNFIGIPNEFELFSGKGVKVAIIDTGVRLDHPDIEDKISLFTDITNHPNEKSDEDGHGTSIAGIIAADSKDARGLKGVAPDCQLICLKVRKDALDNSDAIVKNVAEAINIAVNNNADVINISLDLFGKTIPALTDAINNAAKNKVVLIGSAGDLDELTNPELGVTYPARDPNFTSIGATSNAFVQTIINTHPKRLDFVGGINEFWTLSIGKENYRQINGSSFCAAFLSGLSAVIISRMRNNKPRTQPLNQAEFLSHLQNCISDVSKLNTDNFFSFSKI
jgi:minor extracellular protease Epr